MNLSPQNVRRKLKGPLVCRICGKAVAVEACKADEDGRAIHEDCYVLKIKLEQESKEEQGG